MVYCNSLSKEQSDPCCMHVRFEKTSSFRHSYMQDLSRIEVVIRELENESMTWNFFYSLSGSHSIDSRQMSSVAHTSA